MRKNVLRICVLVSVVALLASCKYTLNIERMLDDYEKALKMGDTEKAEKLYNRLQGLEDKLTDDQYYRFEDLIQQY